MAANNYFGFTHGGTQYSPQPATPYPAHQTTYVQPAQTAYATAAPRTAQAYETYPATHTTGQYAYTAAARPQNAAAPTIIPKATATYDTSKTYYAPAAAAAPAAATVYTVAETPYQTAKPAYSATAYQQQVQPRQAAAAKPAVAHSSAASYVYPAGSTTTVANPTSNAPSNSTGYTATTSASTYSGYDAALYSAATSYYQQQQAAKQGTNWQYTKAKTGTTTTGTTAAPKPKPKVAPKQPQLHYCEVCKISCAGPQTYREHLEGQKHKKKEAAAKSGTTTAPASRAVNQLRCELCDVACTGSDAYAAHIRGAKHQKVLKLHTKLGKPIPSAEPVVLPPTSPTVTPAKTTATTATPAAKPAAGKTTPATTTVTKKVVATPKITFVGQQSSNGVLGGTTKVKEEKESKTAEDYIAMQAEKDVIPVGQEYIEEMKNEGGKVVSFNCKLCECKFNDPNAKEMHMKGRRHRLQYKKKVDPSLMVEVKPSIKARKLQEEKLRRQAAKEEYWRRRDAEERWREEMRFMRMEEEHYFMGRGFGRGMPFHGPGMGPVRRPDTTDDRHVMAKHASIYPTEPELQAVQNIVSSCEKALKLVSDFIAESDAPKNANGAKVKAEVKQEKPAETKDGSSFADKKDGDSAPRALKGVMRVGVLAKGLLLHGDLNVQLVLLCSEKPTRTLLERVADNLPKQLATVAEDNIYEVKMCVEEAAVIVTGEKEPSTTCTITLTSPIMRDQDPPAEGGAAKHGEYAQDDLEKSEIESSSVTVKDPPDVLDRQKCLAALAALRHAKWFQARANGLQSCVVVIRILRDLCQRVPTWTPLQQWAMELLVEKCVSSGGTTMSPGDALRRVFECIASGILLPGGPGLYDPCEKEAQDAAGTLSAQEREDITASAQHALRLIAFRQIHKVLGMDALPVPRYTRRQGFNPRKRRRDNSAGEGEDDAGKKDKKEDEAGK